MRKTLPRHVGTAVPWSNESRAYLLPVEREPSQQHDAKHVCRGSGPTTCSMAFFGYGAT